MELKSVKAYLGHTVLYDIGQISLNGTSIQPFEFSACILRRKENGRLYYQAELKEIGKKSVIIVPLEKVIVKND